VPARLVLWAAAPLGLAVFAIVRWTGETSAFGGRVLETSETPLIEVWELLVAASVVLGRALASAGLRMLEMLPRRNVGGFLVAVYGAFALLLILTGLAEIGNDVVVAGQKWKNGLLHALAAVAILPWLVALERIRLAARDEDATIERVRVLRAGLKGATAALGGMIAVAVILTGALREAVAEAGGTPSPDAYVLVYGAWLTAVLAAIYVRAFGAIERRARSIMDRSVPLPGPAEDGFPAAAERRALLARELELGGDARTNLEGLVAVLAPLAGALLTRFGGL
jgi:hypothetical protein